MDMLIRCAGSDGNMMLNVGPMPTGEIASEQVSLIKEMGGWLEKYGESIYGTRGGPYKPARFGVTTFKGNRIYLHILNWPALSGAEGPGDVLELPAIPAKIIRGTALVGGGKVTITQTDESIKLTLTSVDRQKLDTVVALELDRPAGEIKPLAAHVPSHSLATGKKTTASNVYKRQASFAADKAVDDALETRWATDGGTTNAWLEVDLGKPETISRSVIIQAYPELKRIRKFAIEYFAEGQWKSCYQGEGMGETCDVKFAPVTAQRVRLNVIQSTDGPTIWEFQLFGK